MPASRSATAEVPSSRTRETAEVPRKRRLLHLPAKPTPEEIWAAFLSGPLLGKVIKTRRRVFRLFRADDRCKNCQAPFDHLGALVMPLIGHGRYRKNPRFCRF